LPHTLYSNTNKGCGGFPKTQSPPQEGF